MVASSKLNPSDETQHHDVTHKNHDVTDNYVGKDPDVVYVPATTLNNSPLLIYSPYMSSYQAYDQVAYHALPCADYVSATAPQCAYADCTYAYVQSAPADAFYGAAPVKPAPHAADNARYALQHSDAAFMQLPDAAFAQQDKKEEQQRRQQFLECDGSEKSQMYARFSAWSLAQRAETNAPVLYQNVGHPGAGSLLQNATQPAPYGCPQRSDVSYAAVNSQAFPAYVHGNSQVVPAYGAGNYGVVSSYVGGNSQIVPAYSNVKVNGESNAQVMHRYSTGNSPVISNYGNSQIIPTYSTGNSPVNFPVIPNYDGGITQIIPNYSAGNSPVNNSYVECTPQLLRTYTTVNSPVVPTSFVNGNQHIVTAYTAGNSPILSSYIAGKPQLLPAYGAGNTGMIGNNFGGNPMGIPRQLMDPRVLELTSSINNSDMHIIWHAIFSHYFNQFKLAGDEWTLSPSESIETEKHKHIVKDSAKVRFLCRTCANAWTSMKGRILFRFERNLKTRTGSVVFQLFGQQCDKCRNKSFEHAMWYPEEVHKVLLNIYNKVGEQYYNFQPTIVRTERRAGKPRTQHNSKLCQACERGCCYENTPSILPLVACY